MEFVFVMLGALLSAQPALLVEPAELVNLENVIAVDARSEADYVEGHIPGAVHLPTRMLSEQRGDTVNLLKPFPDVRGILAAAGLDPEKRIVLYGQGESVGELSNVTRLFWILEYAGYPRVALLDGGYNGWLKLGHAPETGKTEWRAIDLALIPETPRADKLAEKEAIEEAIQSGGRVLSDARSMEQYTGSAKSGSVERGGHLPGAVNFSAGDLWDAETGTFKSTDILRDLARDAGATDEKPVISYCNTGQSATVGYFVYRLMGRDDVAVYDGSMTEWTRDPNAPVETGTP